jgi:hypothetical protein
VPARADDPRNGALRREVQRDREFRVDGAVQGEFRGARQRVLHRAARHVVQDLLRVRIGTLDPYQVRVLRAQLLQRALVRAARGNLDLPSRCTADRGRARAAAPVDQVFPDALVTGPKCASAGRSMPVERPAAAGPGAATPRWPPPSCAPYTGGAAPRGPRRTGWQARRPVPPGRDCRGNRRPGCCGSRP